MNKVRILALSLFCGIFPFLFAQVKVSYPILSMPIVSSEELKEDAGELYNAVIAELDWQGKLSNTYTVTNSQTSLGDQFPSRENINALVPDLNPRYVFIQTLSAFEEEKIFGLQLWDPDNPAYPISEYKIPYQNVEDVLPLVPFSIWQITAPLPPVFAPASPEGSPVSSSPEEDDVSPLPPEDYAWKNKWLYLGLRGGPSPRLYVRPDGTPLTVGLSFDVGIRGEFQFFSVHWPDNFFSLSLQTGMDITMDNAINRTYLAPSSFDFTTWTLSVPAVFKINYKPISFLLSLYGGVFYILPLKSYTFELPLGYTVGINWGGKMGPGVLFLDLRISGDIGQAVINSASGIVHKRIMITLSMGYEFGLFDRKRKEE
jgi:hypothetical protein